MNIPTPVGGVFDHEKLAEETSEPDDVAGLLTQRVTRDQVFHYVYNYSVVSSTTRTFAVLVSATTVNVRQVIENGSLRTVYVKDDFAAEIRHACFLPQQTLPPGAENETQVQGGALALTLKSQELVFLSLYHNRSDSEFISILEDYQQSLPVSPSCFKTPGFGISADPLLRAVAIPAPEDTIVLNIKQQVNWLTTSIDCKLMIFTTAFLAPPKEHESLVTFVVVGSSEGKQQLSVFLWSTRHGFARDRMQMHTHRLSKGFYGSAYFPPRLLNLGRIRPSSVGSPPQTSWCVYACQRTRPGALPGRAHWSISALPCRDIG